MKFIAEKVTKLYSIETLGKAKERYLYWWFASDVSDEKVHGNVFTVQVLVNFVAYCRRHDMRVKVRIILHINTILRSTTAT